MLLCLIPCSLSSSHHAACPASHIPRTFVRHVRYVRTLSPNFHAPTQQGACAAGRDGVLTVTQLEPPPDGWSGKISECSSRAECLNMLTYHHLSSPWFPRVRTGTSQSLALLCELQM